MKDFDKLTSALGEVKNLFEAWEEIGCTSYIMFYHIFILISYSNPIILFWQGFDPRRSPKKKMTLGQFLNVSRSCQVVMISIHSMYSILVGAWHSVGVNRCGALQVTFLQVPTAKRTTVAKA